MRQSALRRVARLLSPRLVLALVFCLCACLAACSNGVTFKAKGRTEVGVSVGGHR